MSNGMEHTVTFNDCVKVQYDVAILVHHLLLDYSVACALSGSVPYQVNLCPISLYKYYTEVDDSSRNNIDPMLGSMLYCMTGCRANAGCGSRLRAAAAASSC